jgi:hypothetical protein
MLPAPSVFSLAFSMTLRFALRFAFFGFCRLFAEPPPPDAD